MTDTFELPLTVLQLATILHERRTDILYRSLNILGEDRCLSLLTETLALEAGDGLLTRDGTRRRTPGGVFFELVKQACTAKEYYRIFGHKSPQAPAHTQDPVFQWATLPSLLAGWTPTDTGDAAMKLTLVGRPGTVKPHGQVVVFRLQGKTPPSFAKGLPAPKGQPLTWTILLAARQWNRVKERLESDPEDRLVLEGYPCLQDNEHCLLVQSCVSIGMQRAQKEAQRASLQEPPHAETAP